MQKFCLVFVTLLFALVIMVQSKPPFNIKFGDGESNVKAMCKLPAYKGHCRARILRWRYEPEASKCQKFTFGGCDGNGNNFDTYKECMAACGGI